jgi:hypothetical protein
MKLAVNCNSTNPGPATIEDFAWDYLLCPDDWLRTQQLLLKLHTDHCQADFPAECMLLDLLQVLATARADLLAKINAEQN